MNTPQIIMTVLLSIGVITNLLSFTAQCLTKDYKKAVLTLVTMGMLVVYVGLLFWGNFY